MYNNYTRSYQTLGNKKTSVYSHILYSIFVIIIFFAVCGMPGGGNTTVMLLKEEILYFSTMVLC